MEIGSGSHRYIVAADWARLPDGVEFGTTHAVRESRDGTIYIHNTGKPSVMTFSPDGEYLGGWGDEYSAGAHGMLLSVENGVEYLYLAATSLHFVAKTTLDGREIMRMTAPDLPEVYGSPDEFVPTETAVSPSGEIYVADGYGKSWIHVYAKDGRYLRSLAGQGSGKGQVDQPHGIKIDTRGGEPLVRVADRKNHRLQYFDMGGAHFSFTHEGLRMPCTAVEWGEELYVPDLFSRVTVLDRNDKVILHLGDWPGCWEKDGWPNLPRNTWEAGRFIAPHDLHVDGAGNIYLVEWMSGGTGKVTKLVRI